MSLVEGETKPHCLDEAARVFVMISVGQWRVGAGLSWLLAGSLAYASCAAPASMRARLQGRPDAAAYAELGTWFGSQKQFDCAAEAFANAARLQPDSASHAYMWGLSLFSSGDGKDAVSPLRTAERLDASDIRPRLVLGTIFDQGGQTVDAKKEWRAALAIDPGVPDALNGLSQDMIQDGEYAAAISLLEQPVVREKLSAQQSLNLGVAYARTGQLDKASDVLKDAVKKTPESLPLADELADVLVILEKPREAIAVLEQAMSQQPGDLATRLLYLRILVTAHSDKVREVGRQLLVEAPRNSEALYLNGLVEMEDGNSKQARTYLEQSLVIDPKSVKAHHKLGQVDAELGDLPQAEEHLKQAIALGDQEPEVHFSLAMVQRDRGETAQAKEQFNLFRQLSNDQSNRVDAERKINEGDSAAAAGNPAEAAVAYHEALRLDPGNALVAYKLAMALGKSGDISGEQTTLERCIVLNPSLAEAQNQLGYLAVRRGDTAQAESYYQAAVRASPSYVVAWINLAAALASDARWREAKDSLSHALAIDPGNAKARQLGQAIAAAEAEP